MRERIDESKNVQTTPTRTYCKYNRPLPYFYPNCRTPRHWKFTQYLRTTRPPPQRGINLQKNVGGVTVVYLCTSSGHALYFYQITVGQGPTALAVGAGGGCLDIFTLVYPFSSLSPSLWETARHRLKYCLKGPLNSKQPTKIYQIL